MMKRNTFFLIFAFLMLLLLGYAEFGGSQNDQNQAPNLYPQPGPGELLIVDQLKETNRQLQEQTRLLSDQNRILIDTLEELKRQDSAVKARSK